MTDTKTEKCPNCLGTGQISLDNNEILSCSRCEHTGRIEVPEHPDPTPKCITIFHPKMVEARSGASWMEKTIERQNVAMHMAIGAIDAGEVEAARQLLVESMNELLEDVE